MRPETRGGHVKRSRGGEPGGAKAEEGLTASHCHSFYHQVWCPWNYPHLTPGWVTGSSGMLPGVGRSLSGQPPARALHKTPSCSACSLLSESSSHRKAPAASVCPGQGNGSRKTKTSHGEPTLHARPCHVYDGHCLMSPYYGPASDVVTPVSSGSSERKRDLPEAT